MTQPYFDYQGNLRCSGGESLRLKLGIRAPDDTDAVLTGRSFVMRVLRSDGTLATDPIAGTVDGTRVRFPVPGVMTAALAGKVGLRVQLSELVADGRTDWVDGRLSVLARGPLIEGTAEPGEDEIIADDRGTVIVSTQGAPGDGTPAIKAAALAQQQVGDALTELGETTAQKVAEVDDAIDAIAPALTGAVQALPVGGVLSPGAWKGIPSIYRLLLSGTGTVAIDARNRAGTVTASVASYTVAGASGQLEYPFFGADTVAVRATVTGTATAEVI